MAIDGFKNVIYSQVNDPIVASLQCKCTTNPESGSATLKQPIGAPASTDHHTIVAFKEKASVKHVP